MLDCLKQIKKLPIATNKIIQYESSIPRKRGTLSTRNVETQTTKSFSSIKQGKT
jgi:hypothetical protein